MSDNKFKPWCDLCGNWHTGPCQKESRETPFLDLLLDDDLKYGQRNLRDDREMGDFSGLR